MAIVGMTLGYILGGYDSRISDFMWHSLSWWPLCGGYLILLTLCIKSRYQSAFLLLVGCIWGMTWRIPSAFELSDGTFATIIARSALTDLTSKVVIETETHRIYEASAALKVGEVGALHCIRKNYCILQSPRAFITAPRSALQSIIKEIRQTIGRWIQDHNLDLQPWLYALVLGNLQHVSPMIRDDFRNTGLMHVLVISGFHISIIAIILLTVCQLLLKLLYALRLIRSLGYVQLQLASAIAVAIVIIGFALLTGMGAASQRAALCFLVMQSIAVLSQEKTTIKYLTYIASVQLAIYPLGFFSPGNLMSWFGSLMLIARQRFPGRLLSKLISSITMQFAIVVGARLFFGQWAWWGLLLNLFILDYFTCLSLLALLSLSKCLPQMAEQLLADRFNEFAKMLRILANFSVNFTLPFDLSMQFSDFSIACMFFLLLLIYGYQNIPSRDKIDLDDQIRNVPIRTIK